jgi:2-polyprenyl-6-methoxyphenol hydroxylase-like FAD-dependent oxidoreductase
VRLRLRLRAPELTAASETTFEVVVLGGGPAGCAAATLLARRSHRVALVTPDTPPAAPLAESIPPSTRRIVEELGFLEAVRSAGLHPNRGNTVWWASAEPRVESFPDDRIGVHTDRRRLEEALLSAAEASGVAVYRGTTARDAVESEDGWAVRAVRGDGAELHLHAAWVVDATGRHGLLARREGREPDRSTTTTALVRRWRRPGGWPQELGGHTLIESYADGWAWSVPLGHDVRCFTVMVDHGALEGNDVGVTLERELARVPNLAALLRGAEPAGAAWACPASLYTAPRFAREGLVLAGDAASFIDPLSSFGVKKALSSGWLAGIPRAGHVSQLPRRLRGVLRRGRIGTRDTVLGAAGGSSPACISRVFPGSGARQRAGRPAGAAPSGDRGPGRLRSDPCPGGAARRAGSIASDRRAAGRRGAQAGNEAPPRQ